ncbi:MAG: serpin family protein [Pedobacter sp.]|nr:MAG: serpin family protein [Pedobacter sp.]
MSKSNFLYSLLTISILLVACKKDKTDKFEVLSLTEGEQRLAEANNNLTFSTFKELINAEPSSKNLMASPLSVSMALAMTSNGSNGNTLEGIRNAIQFKDFSEQDVNAYYQKIIKSLPGLDSKVQFNVANSIWYKNGFNVLPSFLSTNTTYFQAKSEALDFGNPNAKNTINSWVNEQTKGRIPTIVDQISSDMVMYLINAMYFKGNWKNQFDKSKTSKADFHLNSTSKIQTDFMSAEKMSLHVGMGQDNLIYELPYGNDIYSMVLVLPKQGVEVENVIENLNGVKWKSWMASLQKANMDIRLPKFKFSYEKKLNDVLTNMGMGNSFSDAADFSRINANGGLKISELKHKTFIEVNEEGTEAAAVTSVGVALTSLPQVAVIDRPFFFAIREKHTGLILFAGIVNNPTLSN